jgi:hypothetical protein
MTTAERHRRTYHHLYEPVVRNGSKRCARCERERAARLWREDEGYRAKHRDRVPR